MTREEANKELIEMCNYINGNIEIRRKQYEALNIAIEALKQPEQISLSDKVNEGIDDKYKYVSWKLDQLEEKICQLEKDVHRLQMGFPICWI